MAKEYFTTAQVYELEQFFSQYKPTDEVIIFGSHVRITDQSLFIKSHLAVIKNNIGKRVTFSYFNRLRAFRKRIESK